MMLSGRVRIVELKVFTETAFAGARRVGAVSVQLSRKASRSWLFSSSDGMVRSVPVSRVRGWT